jgi:hypothetical protein
MPFGLATPLPKSNLALYSRQVSFLRGLPLLKSGHVQTLLQPSFDLASVVVEGTRGTHHYISPPCIVLTLHLPRYMLIASRRLPQDLKLRQSGT